MSISSYLPEGIQAWIRSILDLLPTETIIFPQEAELRAGRVLKAQAELCELRRQLMSDKVTNSSVAKAVEAKYYGSINFPEKTGVREKQARVESEPEYIEISNKLQYLDNDIEYLHQMIKIFENGHLLLRQTAKGLQ